MAIRPYRSYVEISRRQIASNYQNLRAAVGDDVEVLGVVKADAYGHGAVEVSRVLEAEGARWLAVSSVEEGVNLRRAGLSARILVLAGFLKEEREALLEYDLTPALHSIEDMVEINRLACSAGHGIRYHLKIDSGMARMGTRAAAEQIVGALRETPHAILEGLMTHFASAADFGSPQTEQQLSCFEELARKLSQAGFAPAYLHLASTNAVAYGRRGTWHHMVRPGHAIYGYVSPARGEAQRPIFEVQPVLTWKAKILLTKDVPEGTLIGYGGSFSTPRAMRLGVLSVGYADGYPHRLSNKGKVIAGGRWAPITGTVSMDLTTVDLTQSPQLAPGDEVTLLGREGELSLGAIEMARTAGTISYHILSNISPRVHRVYV